MAWALHNVGRVKPFLKHSNHWKQTLKNSFPGLCMLAGIQFPETAPLLQQKKAYALPLRVQLFHRSRMPYTTLTDFCKLSCCTTNMGLIFMCFISTGFS